MNPRTLIPYAIARLTGKTRYLPKEIEWSNDSLVHNFFRTFEFFFGRKYGITHESSGRAYKDEEGIVTQTLAFHTTEALLKYFEHTIRSLFRFKIVPMRIYLPVLQPIGAPRFSSPYLLAIAFVSSAKNTASASSVSVTSFSAGTTNGLLCAAVNANGVGYNFTGVSCTDGSLTEVNHVANNGGHADNNIGLWYIVGTTTASQTVTASASTSHILALDVTSYTGVKQTGQPDASGTNTAATGSTYSQSLTTIADNCWIVWATFNGNTTGGAVSAGANTAVRQNDGNGGAISDTNSAQTPAGSKTMNLTKTGNDFWCSVMASFAPNVAATVNSGMFLVM